MSHMIWYICICAYNTHLLSILHWLLGTWWTWPSRWDLSCRSFGPVGAPNRMARKDQEKLQLLTVVQLYSRRAFPTTKLIGQIGVEKWFQREFVIFFILCRQAAKAWAPRSQDLGAWALTSLVVDNERKSFKRAQCLELVRNMLGFASLKALASPSATLVTSQFRPQNIQNQGCAQRRAFRWQMSSIETKRLTSIHKAQRLYGDIRRKGLYMSSATGRLATFPNFRPLQGQP